MRLSRLLVVPVLAVLLLSAGLPVARAADVPACFCYVNGEGALKTAGPTDAKKCATECQTKYGDANAGGFWAVGYSSWPSANLRCWEKKADCESNLDGDSAGTIDGAWARSQPAECLPKSSYCYSADTSPTYLNVSIAGKRQIINFAEYISVVYNYLMGFAMTVAIVFLMVGGLRYLLGGMSEKSIKGAKDMMQKSVEGFILLMFAYVILYTVNPQLIKLQVPKLPMLRQVTIMDGNDCGTIMGLAPTATPAEINSQRDFVTDQGDYAVISKVNQAVLNFSDSSERGDPRCGVTAEVLAGPGGIPVAEGKTCNFSYCADSKGCAVVGGKGQCVACEEITKDNKLGIIPSATQCENISYPTQKFGDRDVPTAQCVYLFNEETGGGVCGKLKLNCIPISNCNSYMSVPITFGSKTSCANYVGQSAFLPEAVRALAAGGSPFSIADFCSADYCGAAPPGESCHQFGVLTTSICANSGYNPETGLGKKDKLGNDKNIVEILQDIYLQYSCF